MESKHKEKPNLDRWHGAHHYSNKVHLFFVFFLFFALATFIWSYIELNNPRLVHYLNKPAPTAVPAGQSPLGGAIPTATPSPQATPTAKQIFCTQEAMLCQDGKTYVGRTGPNCEFSPCPK